VLDAVFFHHGEWRNQLDDGSLIDVVYQLEANEWQGRRRLQLNLQDLRVAE
jgi:single-stranded-DNA-specific exonuclease